MSKITRQSVQKKRTKQEVPVSRKPGQSLSLSPSAGSLKDRILYLQRTVGNRAVTHLIQSGAIQEVVKALYIQRQPAQPPAPLPVAQIEWQAHSNIRRQYATWQAYQVVRNRVGAWRNPQITNLASFINTAIGEWNNNPGVRVHFGNNFDGNPHRSYLNIKRLFQQRGIPNPARYIRNNIRPITFFNIRTSGHQILRTRLNRAQRALTALGLNYRFQRGTWAFVPRTVNTSINILSNHALGRAIDINPGENPEIGPGGAGRGTPRWQRGTDDVRVIEAVCRPVLPQGFLAETNAATLSVASTHFRQNFNAAWIAQQTRNLRAQEQECQLRQRILAITRGWQRRAQNRLRQLRRQHRRARNQQQRQQIAYQIQQLQRGLRILNLPRGINIARRQLRTCRNTERRLHNLVESIRRRRNALLGYARRGFMNLDVTLVSTLQWARLEWGGEWQTKKDFMHFEVP